MDTPNWRQIVGGTAGVALLGAIGYFGQARIHTDNSPKSFVAKQSKSSQSKSSKKPDISENVSPVNNSEPAGDFNMPPPAKRIKVDISGEVVKPGIYEVSDGDRIEDVIKLAGGLKKDADRTSINLALKLKDEQKILIPVKGSGKSPNPVQSSSRPFSGGNTTVSTDDSNFTRGQPKSSKKQPPANPVNINSATEIELQTIPGIGPSMAKKILDYRTANGEYGQIEDLRNIKGMGEKLFEKIREWITL